MSVLLSCVAIAAAGHAQPINQDQGFKEWLDGYKWDSKESIPRSGKFDRRFAEFDAAILQKIKDENLVGIGFAYFENGRIQFQRGYGYASIERQEVFTADTFCRIASISKMLTMRAAQLAWTEGKFEPNSKVLSFFDHNGPRPIIRAEAAIDPRAEEITAWHLFTHRSGWGETIGMSEVGQRLTADALKIAYPVSKDDMVRQWLGRPIISNPGSTFLYSNPGYSTLARMVEKAYNMDFFQFCQERLLRPFGMKSRFLPATSTRSERHPKEADYYSEWRGRAQSVFNSERLGTGPYELYSYSGFDGSMGWMASASAMAEYFGRSQPPHQGYLFFGSMPSNFAVMRVTRNGQCYALVSNFQRLKPGLQDEFDKLLNPIMQKHLKRSLERKGDLDLQW